MVVIVVQITLKIHTAMNAFATMIALYIRLHQKFVLSLTPTPIQMSVMRNGLQMAFVMMHAIFLHMILMAEIAV